MRLTWRFKLGRLFVSVVCRTYEVSCRGQVLPLHPLDVTPSGLTDPTICVGSFVPQTVSVGAGELYVRSSLSFLILTSICTATGSSVTIFSVQSTPSMILETLMHLGRWATLT